MADARAGRAASIFAHGAILPCLYFLFFSPPLDEFAPKFSRSAGRRLGVIAATRRAYASISPPK